MYAKLNLLQIGIVGVQPQILFLETDATLTQVTATGFLNSVVAPSGVSISVGDIILAKYQGQTASSWFSVSMSGNLFVLTSTVIGANNLGGVGLYANNNGGILNFKGLTAGSGVTLTPSTDTISIAASGGGGGFAYENAYWVSQANGSDTNTGTSIDTPLQTVQQAINLTSTVPTIIYVVDANNNNSETITTLGTGQTLYIVAPGTSFQGTFTQSSNDFVILEAYYTDAYTSNSSSPTYLSGESLNANLTTSGAMYINCGQFAGQISAGATLFLSCTELNYLSIDDTSQAFVSAPFAQNITNAGVLNIWTNSSPGSVIAGNTGTINGTIGNVNFGAVGYAAGTASAAAYTLPTTDGSNSQVLTTNGSGTVSWGAGGGGSNFVYQDALWVAQNNGSDANDGTSINTPLLLMQTAITNAVSAFTTIYPVDGFQNTEVLATSGAGQYINIFAPGTRFVNTFTIGAADTLYLNANYVGNFVNNGGILAFNGGNIVYSATSDDASAYLLAPTVSSDTTGYIANTDILASNATNVYGYSFTVCAGNIGVINCSGQGNVIAGNISAVTNSGTLYALSPVVSSVTNTGNIYGILGSTFYGLAAVTDSIGNNVLTFTDNATPVNYLNIFNNSTGNQPGIQAVGSDTDVNLNLQAQGAGSVRINNVYTLPATDGTAGQMLTTDGAGNLYWS